jgi:hypothetical protein
MCPVFYTPTTKPASVNPYTNASASASRAAVNASLSARLSASMRVWFSLSIHSRSNTAPGAFFGGQQEIVFVPGVVQEIAQVIAHIGFAFFQVNIRGKQFLKFSMAGRATFSFRYALFRAC